MLIGHDDMGVMGICRCRLSLPKERNPFRQCKEKGIGRGINGGIPTDLLIDETKDEDIFGSHLQEAPFLKVLPGRWRRRSVTGLDREDRKSSSKRQRNPCLSSSSGNLQVLSTPIIKNSPQPSAVWLINLALIAKGQFWGWIICATGRPVSIPRHRIFCLAICHYLHPRHSLIIYCSNFFPEFLPQIYQLFVYQSGNLLRIENHLHF